MAITSKNILIVEDELQTRMLLSEIFKLRGHTVRTAEDGFAALQVMREAMPDVLVSDLNMPGMSGFELLSVVRRRLPAVFVVATSGAYAGDAIPEGIAADVFHPKATRIQALVELIDTLEGASVAAVSRKTASAPIWIATSRNEATGEEYAMISCPECLRAMPQFVDKGVRVIHETDCADCHSTVQYAIVQRLNPSTSQPYGMPAN